MESRMTYIDYAEADYRFFRDDYARGRVSPAMAYIGHLICERYLKHVIDRYSTPVDESEQGIKESVLHTHSLKRLLSYLRNDMGVDIEKDTRLLLSTISGYHTEAAYPGEDNFMPTKRDIDEVAEAVEATRDLTYELACEFEAEAAKSKAERDDA